MKLKNLCKNKVLKKNLAFALAEFALTMLIVSIVIAVTFNIYLSHKNNAYTKLRTSCVRMLKENVGNLIADGVLETGVIVKKLPSVGYDGAGNGFCEKFVLLVNTVGTITCNPAITTIPGGTTDFSSKTPNFVLTNGMRIYNMGTAPSSEVYTIYVDIDGLRSKSKLNDDVILFTINRDGTTSN